MAPVRDRAIPTDTALALCAAFQAENRLFWFTPTGMMCWGCALRSRRHPARRYFASRPGNRGCYQINARYDGQAAVAG
jgi:hypothetical protein